MAYSLISRVGLLAIALLVAGSIPSLAAPLMPFRATDLLARATAAEPFGLPVAAVPMSELQDKWRAVERAIHDEMLVLALCEEAPGRCASPAARQFLAIIADGRARDGRARLGEVNRALNLAVRSGDDLALYGATDVWRSPLALLETGAGDCEDYAIAKYVALRAAGVAAQDLRIVILHDAQRHEDHAIVAARLDGRWLMLDNRRMAMIVDVNLTNVAPLFVIDHDGGVKFYLRYQS
jgi:predicted transglutaminase-like cysteine proteinase